MRLGKHRAVLLLIAVSLASALPAAGQGRTPYMNVESPQVHSIELAEVGGHTWLLVCNTPDNSVEIWDTDESQPIANRFRLRVRVS